MMKKTYAIIISPSEDGDKYFRAYIPDWDIYTQGETIEDCLYMAKDAIGHKSVELLNSGKAIPEPKALKPLCANRETVAFVEIDIEELWDPDFTKVTPEERKAIEEAENSGFIDESDIDWDNIGKK